MDASRSCLATRTATQLGRKRRFRSSQWQSVHPFATHYCVSAKTCKEKPNHDTGRCKVTIRPIIGSVTVQTQRASGGGGKPPAEKRSRETGGHKGDHARQAVVSPARTPKRGLLPSEPVLTHHKHPLSRYPARSCKLTHASTSPTEFVATVCNACQARQDRNARSPLAGATTFRSRPKSHPRC